MRDYDDDELEEMFEMGWLEEDEARELFDLGEVDRRRNRRNTDTSSSAGCLGALVTVPVSILAVLIERIFTV